VLALLCRARVPDDNLNRIQAARRATRPRRSMQARDVPRRKHGHGLAVPAQDGRGKPAGAARRLHRRAGAPDVVKTPSQAVTPATTRRSRPRCSRWRRRSRRQSGFRLLTLNTNALLSRVVLAEKARQSIDLQTYIFEDDDTGRLVAQALLKAADRGVRVRLLVDDITKTDDSARCSRRWRRTRTSRCGCSTRSIRATSGAVAKAAQMLMEFRRLNRRMHNKSFIVDNKGRDHRRRRNIGDDYFDASEQKTIATWTCWRSARWWSRLRMPSTPTGTTRRHCRLRPGRRPRTSPPTCRRCGRRSTSTCALSPIRLRAGGPEEMPDGPTADRGGPVVLGRGGDGPPTSRKRSRPTRDAASPELMIAPQVKELMFGAKSELLC
jgi:hypothetical protein